MFEKKHKTVRSEKSKQRNHMAPNLSLDGGQEVAQNDIKMDAQFLVFSYFFEKGENAPDSCFPT